MFQEHRVSGPTHRESRFKVIRTNNHQPHTTGMEAYAMTESTIDPNELLTPSQLAEILQVSRQTIYTWTMGKGPDAIPRRKFGKHLRFDLSAVLRWAEKRAQA